MLQIILQKDSKTGELERLTYHAMQRMSARSISRKVIENVLLFGRISNIRGANIYSVGRKEVERYGRSGIRLKECEGVHVVCSSDQRIITVYRNRDFKGLRPGRRCCFSQAS